MEKSEIGKAASALTREEFGEEVSSFTQLTKAQIDFLFPTDADREELAMLIDVVLNAANENEKRARLIGSINKIAGAVVKLLEKGSLGVA
jgi:hypothetical protein